MFLPANIQNQVSVPIVFDYATFVASFPEMSGVTEPAAQSYFNLATQLVSDRSWPIRNSAVLSNILYLVTAHLAKLLSQNTQGSPTTGGTEGPTGIVGRITTATEGSVSVAADMPNQASGAAWWQQTSYGALVWQFIKPFRLFRYVTNPNRRFYNPPVWGWGARIGPGIR